MSSNSNQSNHNRGSSVGYFSSYDRGLECLLKLWPEVYKQVPEATLDIYYGWNSFDMVHKNNPDMNRWKWEITRSLAMLKDQGVTEHGRVSHEELAQKMKQIKVWAYPTEFNEINCITALKAQQAGMIPVVTDIYALKETVVDKTYVVHGKDIYTSEYIQQEFIKNLVEALKSEHKVDPVPDVDWSDIAEAWSQALA